MFSCLYSLLFLSFAVSGGVLATPIGDGALVRRQQHVGTATWYDPAGVPGACGQVYNINDHVVALQTAEYASGAHCGQTITITDTDNGVTATGVIGDLCPGCRSTDSIDLSGGLFAVFAPTSQGTFNVAWSFN